MYRLRLLGAPCIAGPDELLIRGQVSQRHRLALLALLALAPEPGLSRDQLMAWLWPERDAERGRHLLKQAIYVVRSTLGPDSIRAADDRIRLNTDRIGVDVIEFESALARGDPRKAVNLYRGPFLDGFFMSDAPGFDRWMESERERLAGACGKALENLASAAEAKGDRAGAVEAWKALAAHEPYDSRVALRLIAALETAGNPAGALQTAAAHARRLQEDLGVEPPEELTSYSERLRGEPSARPLQSVSREPGAGIPVAAVALDTAGGDRQAKSKAVGWSTGRRAAYAAAVVVAASAILLLARARVRNGAPADGPKPFSAIAVLPLANRSSDAADAALADGMTREIINVLGERDGLRVSASTSVFALRGRQLDVRTVAESLHVSQVLEGDLQRSGSHLRMHLRLVDALDGLTRWSGTYDRNFEDIFAVQNEVADAVARELGLAIGAANRRRRQPTQNVAAYELYLRGSDPTLLRSDNGVRRRLEYFQRAVALDSTYAAAYSGLAGTYVRLSMDDQDEFTPRELQNLAEASATRGVALDDSIAEAHAMLGVVRMRAHDYASAEKQLRRAIELDPTSAHIHQSLAGLYLVTERTAQGLAEAERAIQMDPLSATAIAELARALLFNGRCNEALAQLDKVAAVHPPLLRVPPIAAQCYAAQRRWTEAIAVLRPQRDRDPVSLALSGYMLGRAGRREQALQVRDSLLDRWRARHQGAEHVALVYAGLGELDQAFAWLDRAIDEGSLVLNPWYGEVMEPAFQDLRRDPRFRRVRERLGLPSG